MRTGKGLLSGVNHVMITELGFVRKLEGTSRTGVFHARVLWLLHVDDIIERSHERLRLGSCWSGGDCGWWWELVLMAVLVRNDEAHVTNIPLF